MNAWQTGPPPNERLVEVEDGETVIVVKAIHGRDGVRPHWTNEAEDRLWPADSFRRWRTKT